MTMNRAASVSKLIAIMFMSLVSCCFSQSSFEASAVCIAKGKKCTAQLSYQSKACKKYTYVARQPVECLRMACRFCTWKSSQGHRACKSWGIRTWCSRFHVFSPIDLHGTNMKKEGLIAVTIGSESESDESVHTLSRMIIKIKRLFWK